MSDENTQAALAAELGISQRTVSRVVSNNGAVSAKTRARVLEAVAKRGYTLNANASNLSTRKKGTIGILIEPSTGMGSVYFLRTFQGINEQLAGSHHTMIFRTFDPENADSPDFQDFIAKVDGVIAFITLLHDKHAESPNLLRKRKLPHVVIQSSPQCQHKLSLTVDNRLGGHQAAKHLIELGHRRLAYMANPTGGIEDQLRYEGFQSAVKGTGLPEVKRIPCRVDQIEKIVKDNFSIHKAQRPTGAFCYSDIIARSLVGEARCQGMIMPRDLSVIGFDDRLDITTYMYPQLTTLRQPFEEIGREALNMLLDALQKGKSRKQHRMLEPPLIVRQTTTHPTKGSS